MKNLLKVLAFGAMLAASSSLAYASPLSGTVTIDGGTTAITPGTLPGGTTSITFATDTYTIGGTGSFTAASLTGVLPGIEAVSFVSVFNIPNTNGNVFTGETLFTFVYNGATTETFTVNSVTTGPNGSLYFYGTLNGTNAVYILTPDDSHNGSFSGTLDVTPTPEPSSLVLLGTGLIGAAGLMFRKRRSVKA
jgi:hypothetical protein